MTSKVFHIVVATCLIAALGLVLAVYWPGLNGPFVLDDMQNIVRVYVSGFDRDELLYAATHNNSGMFGRPVSVLSLMFSGIVHGPETWGYKYHNLLIHLLNGLLLFWLLLKLLPQLAKQLPVERAAMIAGLAAVAWLLHPLMVSTVLYAVQRMAQLSVLFTLAALLFYVFARAHLGGRRRLFFSLAYAGFPIATMLALLSKENGALVPLYVLAIELVAFGFRTGGPLERRRLLVFLGVFAALPLVLGGLYILTHLQAFADYSLRDFSMAERLMTQLYVVAFYLKLILLPRLADMNLFHDDFEVVRQLDLLTLVLLALLALAAALVFVLRRKAPVLSFAIAWFLVSHLMESTFINLELVFEHRNYLAAAGPLFALIYYLCSVPILARLRYVPLVVLALLVFMTANRVQVWRSAPLLFQIAVMEHPRSYRANTEFANQAFLAGDVEKALAHLEVAQDIKPGDFGPVVHEIVYRCGRGEDFAPLFAEARERAVRSPASNYAMNALDNLLGIHNRGRCPELRLDDVLHLVQAAKGQEDIAGNNEYRGYLERIQGHVGLLQGRYHDGVVQLTKAYELTGLTTMLEELTRIQLAFGKPDDARRTIARLESINEGSFGIETAKIKTLRSLLAGVEAVKE